jgi:hypothetical protein
VRVPAALRRPWRLGKLGDATCLDSRRVYQLEVALHETTAPQATRADGTPSRSALVLSATWLLRKLGDDNKVVTHGSLKSSTGYDVLNNDYANVVSNNTGELRAVRDLSDQIQASLAIYFQTPPTT